MIASADPAADPCPAGSPLLRLTAAAYDDGVHEARSDSVVEGESLPSARRISNLVCAQSESIPSRGALSAMVFQWGQFIDHDITLVDTGSESFPVPVPSGDPHFDPFATGTQVIELHRSLGSGSPRDQINRITSRIDGSAVYGSDSERAAALRSGNGGRLRTSPGPDGDLLPFNDAESPLENANENPSLDPEELFLAGDIRANEQCGLIAMHTLFVREHNRLADEIASANPGFNDEEIFTEARRWLTAYMQSITYNEFLPSLLGPLPLPAYSGYDNNLPPCVTNEFSVAAFRIGHSMLPPTLPRLDEAFQEHPAGDLSLASAFFRPSEVSATGIGPFLRGLCRSPQQDCDSMIVAEVRNMLFGPPGSGGLDLAALNIQRGRDHGVGSYNQVRSGLGLAPAIAFSDITSDSALQSALSTAYNGVIDDIDLWIGGMAEDPVGEGLLGETFRHLWIDQFTRLRDGDPCWFENTDPTSHPQPFSAAEINAIRQTSLGDIVARNTGAAPAQATLFELPPPEIFLFEADPSTGSVTLEWSSFLNARYELEACNSLDGSEDFESVTTLSGGDGSSAMSMNDPGAVDVPRRFYRLRQH